MGALHGTCQDCRHFAALDNQCRRNAPMPTVIPDGRGQPVVIGMFPAVQKTQWCGEYASDKTLGERMLNG